MRPEFPQSLGEALARREQPVVIVVGEVIEVDACGAAADVMERLATVNAQRVCGGSGLAKVPGI